MSPNRYEEYSHFLVGAWYEHYKLSVGAASGDAGDSLITRNNNMAFSTIDRDNDKWASGHCAATRKGAWWYNNCGYSSLTGLWNFNSL